MLPIWRIPSDWLVTKWTLIQCRHAYGGGRTLLDFLLQFFATLRAPVKQVAFEFS
jgi:hypothetical protein